jgi:EpsD family peptidyl-prolyl cis-trans isomerase
VLEQLIAQQIAVQKAVDAKLDRDPEVLQALEAARREVLARAYLERQATVGAVEPTPQEIDKYFADKPALFAKRRIYTLDEFIIQTPQSPASIESVLKGSNNARSFAEALKAQHLAFQTNTTTRPAEMLPLELLDKVSTLTEGQGVVLGKVGSVVAVVLDSAAPAPVGIEQARPAIAQFLLNDAKRKKVSAELKDLRTGAKVEYVGRFADAPASSVAPSAQVGLTPELSSAPASDHSASQISPSAVDAGVKGLK